ncbi:hypothetical protein [Nocardia sp. NBC_00511]|uniref:hypothetical protein n=1 Tax=Nocardia sp. NBC_00511 TaxID=2903591 RepID=UPI0030E4E795
MNTRQTLTAIRKPLTCLLIAGALAGAATGVASAEPRGRDNGSGIGAGGSPTSPSTQHSPTITYSTDPYGTYSYTYQYTEPIAPAPASTPVTDPRTATSGGREAHTWIRVPRADGQGWVVCPAGSVQCG